MSQQTKVSNSDYVCPPCNSQCDDLEFDKPGKCSHCNMRFYPLDLQSDYLGEKILFGLEISNRRFITYIS